MHENTIITLYTTPVITQNVFRLYGTAGMDINHLSCSTRATFKGRSGLEMEDGAYLSDSARDFNKVTIVKIW